MATAKWGNPSMPFNQVNAPNRVSGMAALKQGELFAPITFSGSCNRDLWERWLEQSLLPQLNQGMSSSSIMPVFTVATSIDEMVAAEGCELWYLTPYSRLPQPN